ncbi:MAG TPA: DNA (cytosine-5-)-methyltransferase [Streptosporangiaceae bacterium]|nr:DNA (cytosine-5-)-methyltransferase [Streptosporangiaceae bacterium]
MADLEVVEICAGAGGQALGLERAGFEHALAVELDPVACATLRANRPAWKIAEGDVADQQVWRPSDYTGVTLLAGGVPCPPFTVAGRQLGANDERDLYAWAVELCGIMRPRALLLENVRGLSTDRFSAYRQHVLDRLRELGYVPGWRLLQASDFGVPQLRPRTVLVALRPEDAVWFRWPSGAVVSGPDDLPPTVGSTLADLMAARGWLGAAAWVTRADRIAPTIVGGSKKHGGADLGPTRAKRAWAALGVDGMGVADLPPGPDADLTHIPKLTCEMVARLQGWRDEWGWRFSGLKTARYRQIGNAFPPPVAEAVGTAIRLALRHSGTPVSSTQEPADDPVFQALRASDEYLSARELTRLTGIRYNAVVRHLNNLGQDFELSVTSVADEPAYRLGNFKAFLGQRDHVRNQQFAAGRSRIS